MCLRNICMVHQHYGLIPGCGYPTGIFLFIVLSAMYIFSMKYVRTGGYFEVNTYNTYLIAIISLENHLKTFFVPFFPSYFTSVTYSTSCIGFYCFFIHQIFGFGS